MATTKKSTRKLNGLTLPNPLGGYYMVGNDEGYVVAFGATFQAKAELKARGFSWGSPPHLPNGWFRIVDATKPDVWASNGQAIPRVAMHMAIPTEANKFTNGHWIAYERVEAEFAPDAKKYVAMPTQPVTPAIIRGMEDHGWVPVSKTNDTKFYMLAADPAKPTTPVEGFAISSWDGPSMVLQVAEDQASPVTWSPANSTRDSNGRTIADYEVRLKSWHRDIDDYDAISSAEAKANGATGKYFSRPLTMAEFQQGANALVLPKIDNETPVIGNLVTGEERLASIGTPWVKGGRVAALSTAKPGIGVQAMASMSAAALALPAEYLAVVVHEKPSVNLAKEANQIGIPATFDGRRTIIPIDRAEFTALMAEASKTTVMEHGKFPGIEKLLRVISVWDVKNMAARSGGISFGVIVASGNRSASFSLVVTDSSVPRAYISAANGEWWQGGSYADDNTKVVKGGHISFPAERVFDGWRFEDVEFVSDGMASFVNCLFTGCTIRDGLSVAKSSFYKCVFSLHANAKGGLNIPDPYIGCEFIECSLPMGRLHPSAQDYENLRFSQCQLSMASARMFLAPPGAQTVSRMSGKVSIVSCTCNTTFNLPTIGPGCEFEIVDTAASFDQKARIDGTLILRDISMASGGMGQLDLTASEDNGSVGVVKVNNSRFRSITPGQSALTLVIGDGTICPDILVPKASKRGAISVPDSDSMLIDFITELESLHSMVAMKHGLISHDGQVRDSQLELTLTPAGEEFIREMGVLMRKYNPSHGTGGFYLDLGPRAYRMRLDLGLPLNGVNHLFTAKDADRPETLRRMLLAIIEGMGIEIPDPQALIPAQLDKRTFSELRYRLLKMATLFRVPG